MSAEWFYADRQQQQQGPVSADFLQAAYARGEVTAASLVWREGQVDWQPLNRVAPQLGIRVAAASAAPPPAASKPVIVAPKSSPWLLILVIVGVVLLFVGGILAAIAIPAYQDYTVRAHVGEALSSASAVKVELEEFIMVEERCPTNEDDGFRPAEEYAQGKVQAIEIGMVDDGTERCAINLKLRGIESEDDEHNLLMMRNSVADWSYTTTLRESTLPANVRYQLEYD